MTDRSRPLYMIGVVAEMVTIHPPTLRMSEKKGLTRPSRTEGKTRMYSPEDVEEISRVTRLARDLGVNLAGIEIILKMRRRMLDMQARIEELTNHVRNDMADSRDEAQRGKSEALVRAASSQLSPVELFLRKETTIMADDKMSWGAVPLSADAPFRSRFRSCPCATRCSFRIGLPLGPVASRRCACSDVVRGPLIGVFTQRDPTTEDPQECRSASVGTLATVHKC